MIERITDLPGGIFGVRAMGTLTADDYESVIAPFVNDLSRNRKRVRCLVEVGPGFTAVTPAAAWEDIKRWPGRWASAAHHAWRTTAPHPH